ncbi:hypothetical protein DPMN_151369 [Dreissena polymorpha]|uniref:Uncharacterized protein n=1 Tax=Dreissena polymorpha TaxID=45954 RepID=A0A9D4J788_DREPO|nr:hypothetical protein DPMN_151369 [Dreissena polymorpha]
MLFYPSCVEDRALVPMQILQVRIADLKDDLGDRALCDPKAIHQNVLTVPDNRYRIVFANLFPAVRCLLPKICWYS